VDLAGMISPAQIAQAPSIQSAAEAPQHVCLVNMRLPAPKWMLVDVFRTPLYSFRNLRGNQENLASKSCAGEAMVRRIPAIR